jgi:hypothetical protein
MFANENNENQEARPVAPLMEKQIVETTEQELRVDGHHLIDKKQKSFIDANEIGRQIFQSECSSDLMFFETIYLVHIRTIDDKSYKVTEMVTGEDEALERQVETDMTEDEVKQFEEDWTNLWNRRLTPLTAHDDQCLIKKHSVQVKFNSI